MPTHKLLQREDGSQVKIVTNEYFTPDMQAQVHVHVLHRKTEADPWQLASDRPHPDWKQMPLDDYVKFGRSEMLRLVSRSEIWEAIRACKTAELPAAQ